MYSAITSTTTSNSHKIEQNVPQINAATFAADLSNENLVYTFQDDRYPDSNAACNKVPYANVQVTSELDNVLNPPNPNGPTLVDVDVILDKLKNLDLDENTYQVRGALSMVWCDPRLKFDPKLGKYQLTNDDAADLVLKYAKLWDPAMRFRNATEPRTADNIRIYNFNDGTIVYREIFTAALMSKFDLSKMPFDTQYITLDIGSLTFDSDYVEIMQEEQTVMFSDNFQMPEFSMRQVHQQNTTYKDPYTKKTFSMLHAQFVIDRYYAIYVLKIVLPLYLLIFITSLVFTYPNENLNDRIGICLDCILAAVAYQIVVEESVPKYLFFNMLNASVFSSILVMAYGIVVSWVLYRLHVVGYKETTRVMADWMILYYNTLYALILMDLYIFYVLEYKFSCIISLGWTLLGITFMLYKCLQESKMEAIEEDRTGENSEHTNAYSKME